MTGELVHYAKEPVELDRARVYSQHNGRAGKPNGLWVSVVGEDDWASWCEAEGFYPDGLTVAHQVTLTPQANVLWITTAQAIDEFHAAWCGEEDEWYARSPRVLSDEYRFNQRPIDWPKVAAAYDGIIIAPYQWSRRLGGPFWYYGIDAASGCIWNLAAIDTFTVANCNTPTEERTQ